MSNLYRGIRALITSYYLPNPMPWARIAGPLAAAEDALARLDERLRTSAIRDGWVARTHFLDAAASLALDGSIVSLEDLVLHDARLDIRAPTPELTRAHAVLRARRRIASAEPGWALTSAGLNALRGRGLDATDDAREEFEGDHGWHGDAKALSERVSADGTDSFDETDESDEPWNAELAALDAVLARSDRLLAGEVGSARPREDATATTYRLYDEAWDEDERLAGWQKSLVETESLAPVLAAALAFDAWVQIDPLQHDSGLGRLLAAGLLRRREKTRSHLMCLNVGLRAMPYERRQAVGPTSRLLACIEAVAAAAERGLKDHDRWLLMRAQLERKLVGRRSNSKLPALVDLILATPIASTGLIAARLGVTPRAAQDMVAELGLREVTGRGRYRAWGVV